MKNYNDKNKDISSNICKRVYKRGKKTIFRKNITNSKRWVSDAMLCWLIVTEKL